MTEIKILAKCEETYFGYGFWKKSMTSGENINCAYFTSQETEMENGKEVPKWGIFVALGHPEMEKLWKSRVGIDIFFYKDERKHSYEISFVDGEKGWVDRKYPHYANNKRIRFFIEAGDGITIKDNSYSDKLEELKSLNNNLIPGEEQEWRSFIASFRKELDRLTNQDVSKYQKGKKFIDELEAELNKKTGKKDKNNKDDDRERERERESKFALGLLN